MFEDPTARLRAGLLAAGAVCLVLSCAGPGAEERSPVPRIGGCSTRSLAYGPAPIEDSLAAAAIDGLLAPAGADLGRAAREALGCETPLFAEIGALDEQPEPLWSGIAEALTARLRASGLHVARRSELKRTRGPCFPPYHIDLQACGDSAAVAAFLDSLPVWTWKGLVRAPSRRERDLFISAGTSMESMNRVIDLEAVTPAR